MQVRDNGDLDQIDEVPITVVKYEYVLELEPTKFLNKLNDKHVRKKT